MVTQGTHILSEGKSPVTADVVFVHGLKGDAFKTWSSGEICWPRDLLSLDLENARIITWGYDSTVAKPGDLASQLSIFGHAENLLGDLSWKRRNKEEKSRPIVLVGHSLGGLVIKSALIRSSEYLNNRQNPARGAIYSCTAGVVFLGTPHRGGGSPGLSLAHFFVQAAKAAFHQPNAKLVGNLDQASDFLEQQRRSFASISERMPVACFFEEMPVPLFGMIVPEHSACIDGFRVTTGSIPANHIDMCKYTNNDALGYQRVSREIISLVDEAPESTLSDPRLKGHRHVEEIPLVNDRGDRACLDALFVTNEEDHMAKIQDTKHQLQAGTCLWISTDPTYDTWFHEPFSEILWLRGDAGKGKTLIAIRQITELRNTIENSGAILLYFFHDGKDHRRNNAVVTLRGLLYQLLYQRPGLIKWLRSEYETQKDQLFSSPNALQSLWRILEVVLQQCTGSTVWLVIDALDECESGSRGILLRHIVSRVNGQRVMENRKIREKWFLISRNEGPIREYLSGSSGISLESNAKLVTADVEAFINAQVNELQETKKYRGELRTHVRQTLSKKAEGTFLWVSLACAELKRVPSIKAKKVLEKLPSGLPAIYDQILHQVLGNEDENLAGYTRDILVSVLAAFRPLKWRELAVMAGLPVEHRTDIASIRAYAEQCGSFLTIGHRDVRLVHQSAKDYLTSTQALTVSPTMADEHKILTMRCLSYICSGVFDGGPIDLKYRDTYYPFKPRPKTMAQYPVSFWMEHGKLASPDLVNFIDQKNELFHSNTSLRDAWFATYWRLTDSWGSAPQGTSPMHLAAYSGIEPLVKTIMHWDTRINMKDARHQTPLSLAAAEGHDEVVRHLLSVADVDPNHRDYGGQTPLLLAATFGHERVVKQLLGARGINPNCTAKFGETPLSLAAGGGYRETVKQLLNAEGIDPNCKGSPGNLTPLSIAAISGHEEIVRDLLSAKDVDPNCKDVSSVTPLIWAVRRGHEQVVRVLLSVKDIDPNRKDEYGNTPLTYAAKKGHKKIVQQLIWRGADPDCNDPWGRTPRSYNRALFEAVCNRVKRDLPLS